MYKKLLLVFTLLAALTLLSGCDWFGQPEQQLHMADGETISVTKSVDLNEEIKIDFSLKDYSDEAKRLKGKAYFKVTGFASQDTLADLESKADRTFYYATYEFKADKDNPQGDTIHPAAIDELGADPAPQLVMIIDGKEQYSSEFSGKFYEEMGWEAPKDVILTQEDWVKLAAVWYDTKDKEVTLALKYFDTSGNPKYIIINK